MLLQGRFCQLLLPEDPFSLFAIFYVVGCVTHFDLGFYNNVEPVVDV
jgi:hypothetical protein